MKQAHVAAILLLLAASGALWWSRREAFVPVFCSSRNGNQCVDLGSREQVAYSGA